MEKNHIVKVARQMAIKAHAGQTYGDLPYMYHVDAVVGLVTAHYAKVDPTAIAIALLHDTVEDTPLSLHEIREALSGRVAQGVDYCTDLPGKNRKERKRKTNEKLVGAPEGAKAVKLADRIANMKASIEGDKAEMYRREFPEFMRAIGNAPFLDELRLLAYEVFTHSVAASWHNKEKGK